MEAAPPRPRRVGSAPAAPRPSACGGCAPTPPEGLAAQPRPRGRARVVYGGLRPPRPRWRRGPEAERVLSMGGCAPHAPIAEEHALRAALAHPPALGVSFCGAAPPRPRRAGSAIAAPRPSACCLWGAAPPTPPSRRSTRCARLWPARPPSEFRSVGAAPPRPRRVGSATAAPRAGARLCMGGWAPHARPRSVIPGSTRCARLWPARPRSFFLWGLRPHAPDGLAAQRGPEAERVLSAWLRPAPRWPTGMRPQGTRSHLRTVSGARCALDFHSTQLVLSTATWMLRGVLGTRSRADARGSERASA